MENNKLKEINKKEIGVITSKSELMNVVRKYSKVNMELTSEILALVKEGYGHHLITKRVSKTLEDDLPRKLEIVLDNISNFSFEDEYELYDDEKISECISRYYGSMVSLVHILSLYLYFYNIDFEPKTYYCLIDEYHSSLINEVEQFCDKYGYYINDDMFYNLESKLKEEI